MQRDLDRLTYLLKRGDAVSIFPEGGRSRSGRVEIDRMQYGVGRLAKAVEPCDVLCVYLRGRGQQAYSDLPRRGEEFYVDLTAFRPETTQTGLRATRDIASQIGEKLVAMEEAYFGPGG
jgi:hypothetical protein